MYRTYHMLTIIVYFIYSDYCKVYARRPENTLNTIMKELHAMYKDAFENEIPHIARRLSSHDGHTHYTLNVQKLKEVNGVKTHNLRVIGRTRDETPIIYINNPVEAQMPNAFLQLDQFKIAMFDQVAREKKEFNIKRNFLRNAIRLSNNLKPTNLTTTAVPIKINKADFHDFAIEIINEVNKNIKQEVNVSNNTKSAMKTATKEVKRTGLQKRHGKINKRRKRRRVRMSTTTADRERTTNTTTDETTTTGTTADEDTTTETTSDEVDITTDEETATETTTSATTETTIKTTRTRQAKPYVFMGGK